jgi:hypothetical protein
MLDFLGLQVGATPKAIRAKGPFYYGYGDLPIPRALAEGKGVGLVRRLLDAGGAE